MIIQFWKLYKINNWYLKLFHGTWIYALDVEFCRNICIRTFTKIKSDIFKSNPEPKSGQQSLFEFLKLKSFLQKGNTQTAVPDNDSVGCFLKLKWNPGTDLWYCAWNRGRVLGSEQLSRAKCNAAQQVSSAVHCSAGKLENYFSCTPDPLQPPIWHEIRSCPTKLFDPIMIWG